MHAFAYHLRTNGAMEPQEGHRRRMPADTNIAGLMAREYADEWIAR